MAQKGAQHGPSSSTKTQDPREGPSLAGQTTRSFLRRGLIRLAHEEAERSRRGTSRGALDTSHDDQRRQAGASRAVSSFPLWCKGSKRRREHQAKAPFSVQQDRASPTAERKSLWSPSQRHHQSLWQARTNFSRDKCTRCSPSKWPIVGALPAQYLGRGPGPLPINRTSHP